MNDLTSLAFVARSCAEDFSREATEAWKLGAPAPGGFSTAEKSMLYDSRPDACIRFRKRYSRRMRRCLGSSNEFGGGAMMADLDRRRSAPKLWSAGGRGVEGVVERGLRSALSSEDEEASLRSSSSTSLSLLSQYVLE